LQKRKLFKAYSCLNKSVQDVELNFLRNLNFVGNYPGMLTDEILLSKVKKLIEAKVGWGDSIDWTNQDFLVLSKKIQKEIEVSVSHVTLKRIWGKVRYDSLPNNYTLSTLVQFLGYENWRDFKMKNRTDPMVPGISAVTSATANQHKAIPASKGSARLLKPLLFTAGLIGIATCIVLFTPAAKKKVNPEDYSFSSKKILKMGLPNSVIFDYDATKAPFDSVIIQQSWDTSLRTKVSKDQHQHTLIYYFPGFFEPKLVVDNQVVKEHNLLIKSDGWLIAVAASPMPVYFKKEDAIANGKMALPIDKIKAQNISITPQAPLLSYCNVQDFGEIYSDNFIFETSLRNDYREGSSVCQMTNIYLLCEGTAVGIPLCAKGCESAINFFFTGFKVSGKQQDLSCFGFNFNNLVKVKIESINGKAKIFLNDKFSYEVDHDISKSKIIGIDFVFQGTGTVDYVKLTNNKVSFEDGF
jgi:hypothetical protein